MSHDVADTPAPADPAPASAPAANAPAPAAARAPQGASFADLFLVIYRFLYNKYVGLVIILIMAVFTLIGTLIQQVPSGVREDPQAYASWLDTVRPAYGGWTTVLDITGMFHVYSSIWFVGISVLLAASIAACTTHRIPQLWQRAVHPRTHVTERFFDHARQRAAVPVAMPAADAARQVRDELARRRYRLVDDPQGPGINLYADRNRWAPFGTAAAHLGFIFIIVGVLVSALAGFQASVPVTVGERATVGHGTDLQVEAVSFSDTYYDDGRPMDYVSHLVVYRDGTQVAEKDDVRVNDPLNFEGVRFHQSFFGVATVIEVTDANGDVVYSGGVPLQWTSNDGSNSIGRVDLPEGVDVIVVTAASGQVASYLAPGQLQFEIYPTGQTEPIGMEIVSQGGSATIGEFTYTFHREQEYTGIAVHKDPGAIWVWVASALMILGMCLTFGLRHRRLWVRVHDVDGGALVRIASVEKQDFHFDRKFAEFATKVQGFSPGQAVTVEERPEGNDR